MATEHLQIPSVHTTLEGQIKNAFMKGRGRILKHPILIMTNDGARRISSIKSLSWAGPETLVALVNMQYSAPTNVIVDNSARLQLDLRDSQRNGELVIGIGGR
ncbi:MAG: hypothetical protein WAQ27_00920 [Candidatus Microsaccharimonas sp.]